MFTVTPLRHYATQIPQTANLSVGSPKDAVASDVNERLRAPFDMEMSQSDGSANGDSVAFVRACRRAFEVTSGAEALDVRADI